MIDYDKPDEDPVVAEVRAAREEYAAQFNFDLRAIFDDLQRRAGEAARTDQQVVSPPPRPPETWQRPSKKVG